jgi:hypothetical protein
LVSSTTHDQRIGITCDGLGNKDFSVELFVHNLKHRFEIAVPREPFEDRFDHDEYDAVLFAKSEFPFEGNFCKVFRQGSEGNAMR